MSKFLNIIIIISIIVIIIILIALYRYYVISKNAVYNSWFNKLYCGQINCPKPIDNSLNVPIQNGTTYNNDVARYCADLVIRVEIGAEDVGGKIVTPTNLTYVASLYNLNDNNAFGVIWTSTDTIWIIFRGTVDIQEWAQDFTYNQGALPEKHKLSQLQLHDVSVSNTPFVHAGFLEVYTKFRDNLYTAIKNLPQKQIIVTGHSLGAGVSTICALDLSMSGYTNVINYNFASPRVGNNEFCDLVNTKLTVYRLVNSCDIIPTMPPSVSPNFSEVDKPYVYTHCGIAREFTINTQALANNHFMKVYIQALTNPNKYNII